MTEQEGKVLLQKYERNQCTPEEKALVESWYNELVSNTEDMQGNPDYESWYKRIKADLPIAVPAKPLKIILWPKLAIAASIVVVIGLGLYFYPASQNEVVDIEPGTNTATLTLSNGKTIRLTAALNGKLAAQAGVSISKSGSGQLVYELAASDSQANGSKTAYNTLTTANAESYSIKLSDGTVITLNAATKIKFPTSFSRLKKRIIELEGEAYFEVNHDAEHPFLVHTKDQRVEDLGTEFNINAYSDDATLVTTLVEGSAKVSVGTGPTNGVVLKPGQQTILTNSTMRVAQANMSEVTAWKDKLFKFKKARLEDILLQVARWYNVSVSYESQALKNRRFSGSISRFSTVSKVLEKLEIAGDIHFKIEGRRIIVKD
ncbi:DUF4974 domain-containing protein [Pedobacter sp. MC2016-14]|uniref:FecR family protein n=1 Tax=Pedobacter sp. MC2016-14 TaxID=2897327 RepID=UPI001E65B887|nr:FecR domain-containing protein [Pedobacter sp. MC2016-14]MCD0488619.1 DUF4974 domain-containing protein [Pedobacter sp. MC2016-14]